MSDATTTLTNGLARGAAQMSLADHPREVVDMAKLCILDSLGCMVVGRSLRPGALAATYAAAKATPPEASVIATQLRVEAEVAAFANGTAAHADEIDDVGDTLNHPGAAIVPAALALAERQGAGGRELLDAVIVGYEVGARVIRVVGPQRTLFQERHTTGDSMLVFGSTAAGGRLLSLSADQFRHAFAYAAMHAGATISFMDDATHVSKAVNLGNAARAGVLSATLASLGFVGNDDVFGAPHGVLDVWSSGAPVDPLLTGFGENHEILRTHFKLYSAGYPIHAPVHGVLTLMREHALGPGDIADLTLRMTSFAAGVVSERSTPSICVEDMVAVAAHTGALGVREAHNPALLTARAVPALRGRITVERDPRLDAADPNSLGAHVTLRVTDGRTLQVDVPRAPGDWRNSPRVGWADLAAKFREMCSGHITASSIDDALDAAQGLDELTSIEPLVAPLCVSRR